MPVKMPVEFTLSGLSEGSALFTMISGPRIDDETSLPTFRGEKKYFEDKEEFSLASVDEINSKPFCQWRWFPKRFVNDHTTPTAFSHFTLAEFEAKIVE